MAVCTVWRNLEQLAYVEHVGVVGLGGQGGQVGQGDELVPVYL